MVTTRASGAATGSDTDTMKRLLRQYVRWHQRQMAELMELRDKLQQAQQAVNAAEHTAAEAQGALQLERGELMAANHRADQQQGALQAALEALRQATTDGVHWKQMAEKLTLEVAYWKGNTRVVQYSPSVSNLQGSGSASGAVSATCAAQSRPSMYRDASTQADDSSMPETHFGPNHGSVNWFHDNDTEDDGAGDTPMDLPDSCPASGGFPLVTDEHAMSPSGPSGSAGSPGQVPITCAAGQQLEPRMDHTTHSELGDKGPVSPAQNMSSSTTGAQRLRSSCLGKRSLNAERPAGAEAAEPSDWEPSKRLREKSPEKPEWTSAQQGVLQKPSGVPGGLPFTIGCLSQKGGETKKTRRAAVPDRQGPVQAGLTPEPAADADGGPTAAVPTAAGQAMGQASILPAMPSSSSSQLEPGSAMPESLSLAVAHEVATSSPGLSENTKEVSAALTTHQPGVLEASKPACDASTASTCHESSDAAGTLQQLSGGAMSMIDETPAASGQLNVTCLAAGLNGLPSTAAAAAATTAAAAAAAAAATGVSERGETAVSNVAESVALQLGMSSAGTPQAAQPPPHDHLDDDEDEDDEGEDDRDEGDDAITALPSTDAVPALDAAPGEPPAAVTVEIQADADDAAAASPEEGPGQPTHDVSSVLGSYRVYPANTDQAPFVVSLHEGGPGEAGYIGVKMDGLPPGPGASNSPVPSLRDMTRAVLIATALDRPRPGTVQPQLNMKQQVRRSAAPKDWETLPYRAAYNAAPEDWRVWANGRRESEEKARRESEEKARRESEEKARRAAESAAYDEWDAMAEEMDAVSDAAQAAITAGSGQPAALYSTGFRLSAANNNMAMECLLSVALGTNNSEEPAWTAENSEVGGNSDLEDAMTNNVGEGEISQDQGPDDLEQQLLDWLAAGPSEPQEETDHMPDNSPVQGSQLEEDAPANEETESTPSAAAHHQQQQHQQQQHHQGASSSGCVEDDETSMQPGEEEVHGQIGEEEEGELVPAGVLPQPAKRNKRTAREWDIQGHSHKRVRV